MFAQGGLHYSVANIRSLPSDMFFRFLITEDVHEFDEDGEPRTKPLYLDVCQMMRTKAHCHYGEHDVSSHPGAAVSVHARSVSYGAPSGSSL